NIESIQVTATLDAPLASIEINGTTTASGAASAAIALSVGANAITVKAIAESGASRTITITVTRAEAVVISTNADLASLVISSGDLVPTFAANTLIYSVSVTNVTDSMMVTPTAADVNASITVNSADVISGATSGSISLSVGDTAIAVVVTAEDGTSTIIYTVNVTRDAPLSTNADLSGIALSNGSIAPAFAAGTLSYTASVAFDTTAITVTPTLADANATVMVNSVATASGAASEAIDLAEGENTITLSILAEDGTTSQTYTITVTRQTATSFAQEAYIKASNSGSYDRLGDSLAISGNTLAVGAAGESSSATGVGGDQTDNSAGNSGAVYIFTRDINNVWTQQAYIKASNTDAGDRFGTSLSLSGDTLAIGAPEEDSNATGVAGSQDDNSAPSSGAAYIFTRDSVGVWTQQAYIKASNAEQYDMFGFSIVVSGDLLAVGAIQEDSNTVGIDGNQADNSTPNSGAVYAFSRTGNEWTQQAYIKASNTGWRDQFGEVLAMSENTLVVGAKREDSNATGVNGSDNDSKPDSGAAYIFTYSSSTGWSQDAYLKASNTDSYDFFAESIAILGDTLAIGATLERGATTGIDGSQTDNSIVGAGAVYIFTRGSTNLWSQQAYIKTPTINYQDNRFGSSVALSANQLAIGSSDENSNATGIDGDQNNTGAIDSGAVYIYKRENSGAWAEPVYVKASNTDSGDNFSTVALSDSILAVGASGESSSSTGIDGNQGDNSMSNAGAVYTLKAQ
ncbi:MAG: hypothetical protein DRQ47_01025, partial [Gammaproteobacteria bacterium]